MTLQWYVLRSKPNKEMILWREVTARGFDCFYPQLHVGQVNLELPENYVRRQKPR